MLKITIMLVNFIHKWVFNAMKIPKVCFVGFIVAMNMVKRILGNNNFDSNFDSLSSSSLIRSSSCRFFPPLPHGF